MAKAKHEGYKLAVDVDSSTWQSDEGSGGGPYSYRGETSSDHSVVGLRLLKGGEYARHDTEVLFKPERGKVYYVLYATYSTGDSFGTDYNKCFELIGVYKDVEVAEFNRKRLDEGQPVKKGSDLIPLKVEGLKKMHNYYRPWKGYFERLVGIYIESLSLN